MQLGVQRAQRSDIFDVVETQKSLNFLQVIIFDVLNDQGAHSIELEAVLVDSDFNFLFGLELLFPESLSEPN